MNEITGVHIFEKLGPIEWEDELIAIQALSALTWKKYHGRIDLYCNEEHLESLKKWGVDKIYDKIDTELFSTAPPFDRQNCWSFCKIYITTKLDPPFVLVDTDLWIRSELEFDTSKSFIAYHEENFDFNSPTNFYNKFDDFIPEKYINYYDNETKPVNVAALFWNDKELINEWYEVVCEVLDCKRKSKLSVEQKTTFLEQWLLPMIAKKTNRGYSTFVSQIFNSTMQDFMADDLWEPRVSEWSESEKLKFENIKHIWGLKKKFNYEKIMHDVFNKVRVDIEEFNIKDMGLIDLDKLIDRRSNFVKTKKVLNSNSTKILYCIPSLITDNSTNILIKRIKSLYDIDNDIIIYVCKPRSNSVSNQNYKNEIIDIIGTDNFIEIELDELDDTIKNLDINVCHYEISSYDENFNSFMEKKFIEKKTTIIKSIDGLELISNNDKKTKIPYPKENNVVKLLNPNIEYEHNKNELPIHVKYQERVLFNLGIFNSHIVCLGDVNNNNIPSNLYKVINEIHEINPMIEFHFFNYIDANTDRGKKIITSLSPSTKIWLENINFYKFIMTSDIVIVFNNTTSSLINEVVSYGIPILNVNEIPNLKSKIISLLTNKPKSIIGDEPNNFGLDYQNFIESLEVSNNH